MGLDRDSARTRVAQEGLTQLAVERIARTSLHRMPITLVDRARSQLGRFFSEAPWTVEDDAGLSAIIGPGEGWMREELAPGLRIEYGWRGGTFRIDLDADPAAPGPNGAAATIDAKPSPFPEHERTLGDTFEDYVVIEVGRNPAELRFATGPGTTHGSGRFTRDEQGNSAGVAALFREFEDIETIRVEPGAIAITARDAASWQDMLLQVFDMINDTFVPPRQIPPDRQYERALDEIGALNVHDPRDLARVLDATTSPDAAFRRVAVAKLETADTIVVQKPWTRCLEDSSRAVRRAALRAMAHVARSDLRLMFERALVDKDPCVRYYALRGLAVIGVGRADQSVERKRRDDDIRVRLAAIGALEGRVPQ